MADAQTAMRITITDSSQGTIKYPIAQNVIPLRDSPLFHFQLKNIMPAPSLLTGHIKLFPVMSVTERMKNGASGK